MAAISHRKKDIHMRKVMSFALLLGLLSAPALADEFAALERGASAGRIIYSMSDNRYFAKGGEAITEEMLSGLKTSDYAKTGIIADGNSRLILRYKATDPGSVTFSVSPQLPGSRLESFTTRAEITSAQNTVITSNGNQVSAVFIAPEAWPEAISYPKGTFTITAQFTPTSGGRPNTETLTLNLQAPPVVLFHGAFGDNERMFGYATGSKSGVWHKLENAGLTVASWNYDSKKSPKALISSNTNGLAQIIADTLNTLNSQGFAATRVDFVTHSTGGIVARQYLRTDVDTGNATPNSYGNGTVRRVVTIASPNLGTPIASYIAGNFSTLPSSWQNWQAKSWWEGLGHTLLKALALRDYDVDEAMNDLSLKSSYLAGLGYPGVPFHSIYGKVRGDEAKISQLFDDVATMNKVSLSKIDWLPQRLVETLTSSKLAIISGVVHLMSDDMRFKELLGAFFGDDDYDLVVSEPSAKDNFPSSAVTAFEGLAKHSHVVIGKQDDVGDRVVELLRGSRDNFSVNTASTSEYNTAFDSAVSSFSVSEEGRLNEYVDENMSLETTGPVGENATISGKSEVGFDNDIYVVLDDGQGRSKFFRMNLGSVEEFNVDMEADKESKGLFEVWYFTVQGDELKISPTYQIAYAPRFSGSASPELYSQSRIYAHVGDEVSAGLVVEAEGLRYDISAPALGVASYSVADTSVAEVTDDGKLKALKVGTTTITASAYGKTTTMTFVVKGAASESDTTHDIWGDSSSDGNKSSSGGCDAGLTALALLVVCGLALKRR